MKPLEDYQQIDYTRLLTDVQAILEVEKYRSEKALNLVKVQTYWLAGERIFRDIIRFDERAPYGKQIITSLSQDLDFSTTQLKNIIKFHKTYPAIQYLSPNLTWSHYCELITVEDQNVRKFYETQTLANRWSIRELRQRIKNNEYQKTAKVQEVKTLPLQQIPAIGKVIKDTYDLNFLNLSEGFTEYEMEQELLNHVGRFLMELGYGFSFVGSQYKVLIGNQIHHIDLLFFHISLCCYVIVDLKVEKFCDRFVGQMNKYLTYFRERECLPYMKDPIGLIICKEKNSDEVHYALGRLSEEIFVAEYSYYLPAKKELLNHLNSFSVHDTTLTPRQARTIKSLPIDKTFTIHDYKKIAGISEATSRRDLNDLLQNGKVTRQGHGKNTVYKISES